MKSAFIGMSVDDAIKNLKRPILPRSDFLKDGFFETELDKHSHQLREMVNSGIKTEDVMDVYFMKDRLAIWYGARAHSFDQIFIPFHNIEAACLAFSQGLEKKKATWTFNEIHRRAGTTDLAKMDYVKTGVMGGDTNGNVLQKHAEINVQSNIDYLAICYLSGYLRENSYKDISRADVMKDILFSNNEKHEIFEFVDYDKLLAYKEKENYTMKEWRILCDIISAKLWLDSDGKLDRFAL